MSLADLRQLADLLREISDAAGPAAEGVAALAEAWRLWREHGLRPWLSQKEFAEWLGVSEGTVSAWVRAGILPSKRPDPEGRAYIPTLLAWRWINTPDNRERIAAAQLKLASGGRAR